MKEKLLRSLLLSALIVSALAPAAIASAQGWRHPHEGMVITVGPSVRRVYRHHHWVVMHHRRWHGRWIWR